MRKLYTDFDPTLAQEKLSEVHGVQVSVETLRTWMIEDELWLPKLRRRARVQQPRQRRPRLGELVQERHGKPVAPYSDKASVFRVNAKETKNGPGITQFARALDQLNVDIICANTPAAKGRVERAHQTLQDRLVKEVRLQGINNTAAANAFAETYMADYNKRFAKQPRSDDDAHRPLLTPPGESR